MEFNRIANEYFYGIEGRIYTVPSLRKGKDMDLVTWMHFDKLNTKITAGFVKNPRTTDEVEIKLRRPLNVWFNSALLIFELKKHNTSEGISIKNGKLYVRYGDSWHDASEQSFKQSFALQSFFKERLNIKDEDYLPLPINLLWLYRCNEKPEAGNEIENTVYGSLNMKELLEMLLKLRPPVSYDDGKNIIFDMAKGEIVSQLDSFFENLKKEKANGIGLISRNKLELITQKGIEKEEQSTYNSIGQKLTIIKGKPGTGKTIFLIRLTNHLQNEENCPLLLTYNKALIQDIKRIIFYSGGHIGSQLNIKTIYSFLYDVLTSNGIMQQFGYDDTSYFDNYEGHLKKLYNLIKEFTDPTEVRELLKVPYNTVLVDEAQDCFEIEKDLIYKIFGCNQTIVSYGNKQLVRKNNLDWGLGITKKDKNVITLNTSYRNKNNLVDFFNAYSEFINGGFSWELHENKNIPGGKILIFIGKGSYSKTWHQQFTQSILQEKYSMYDMMFFTPSNFSGEFANGLEEMINTWGYKCFNLSNNKNSLYFPIDEHRILNFRSCRGLEAWISIIWRFDAILEDIKRNYEHDNDTPYSYEEGLRVYTDNWIFMLFTRAIDTLIITLEDESSKEAQAIIRLSESAKFKHMAQIYRL